MKKIIILLFALRLFSANLINVDFFTHKHFVDILFSLDSKFNGKVIKVSDSKFYITNIFSTKEYFKKFDNFDFINSVDIKPYKDGVLINIDATNFLTKFDLTPEGYGLRLRIKSKEVIKKDSIKNLMSQNPETKFDYLTYSIILAILIILAIILYLLKKRVVKLPDQSKVNVIFQKPLDAKNKVVLIEFNKRKYLMVIGNTNLLIDIFDENMVNINTNKEFEDYLKINNKIDELKKYIKNAEELKEFDERI